MHTRSLSEVFDTRRTRRVAVEEKVLCACVFVPSGRGNKARFIVLQGGRVGGRVKLLEHARVVVEPCRFIGSGAATLENTCADIRVHVCVRA